MISLSMLNERMPDEESGSEKLILTLIALLIIAAVVGFTIFLMVNS